MQKIILFYLEIVYVNIYIMLYLYFTIKIRTIYHITQKWLVEHLHWIITSGALLREM